MSGDKGGVPVRRPRMLEPARVGWPRPLRDLKDLLYEVYLAAGAPSLDDIAQAIDEDTTLLGSPSRDTVRRCISDPTQPPQQADAVAVARVLAVQAAWDADGLAARVRELWVAARMSRGAGRALGEFDDRLVLEDLEVHPALDVTGHNAYGAMPTYLSRKFDAQLGAIVDAARAGRSGIAVLVGGSSTGKTRALWEAVKGLPEEWHLWHPLYPTRPEGAVAGLADVAPRTIVWLNEAQHYLDSGPLGEQVAAGLRSLLGDPGRAPVLVLATLWPKPWETLTSRGGLHPQAGELLDKHRITVPNDFVGQELARLGQAADPRLRDAAHFAGDGQITQYLAGVPMLLDRYRGAQGITAAFIHAAMDARRLGAGPILSLKWLAQAAPGYLSDTEWNQVDHDTWLARALDYVTTPCKGIPGLLTPVKTGALRNQRVSPGSAVTAARDRSTCGPSYQLADYLDQYGRLHRVDQVPPIDFWTAASALSGTDDLNALAKAARHRGLYRDAAQLYKISSAHGDHQAAHQLVDLLRTLDPNDRSAARWAAAHASVENPAVVRSLFVDLRDDEAHESALLAKRAAEHISLDDGARVADLLHFLSREGTDEAYILLAHRAAAHISLDNPAGVAHLLGALWRKGVATEEYKLLAKRAAAHVSLDNAVGVVSLLKVLWDDGAADDCAALAERAGAHVSLDDRATTESLLLILRECGADDALTNVARRVAAHALRGSAGAVAGLLSVLGNAGAHEQVIALAKHVITRHSLDEVAKLLEALHEVGASDEFHVLAKRAATHAPWTTRPPLPAC